MLLVGILLQGAEGSGGPGFVQFVPFILIFLIFYFLLIRPQQRQQKEHEAVLKSIEKGDRVVTVGGLHGLVTGTTEDVLTIEIASMKGGERIRVKVDRGRIEKKLDASSGGENS